MQLLQTSMWPSLIVRTTQNKKQSPSTEQEKQEWVMNWIAGARQ
jgi:hypothetical protein